MNRFDISNKIGDKYRVGNTEKGYIPDWEWMENYIKSLPYSDKIERV